MAKWISVKDEMPNYDECVLVYLRSPDSVGTRFHIGYRSATAGDRERPAWMVEVSYFYSDGGVDEVPDEEITHWKPLPQPPVED